MIKDQGRLHTRIKLPDNSLNYSGDFDDKIFKDLQSKQYAPAMQMPKGFSPEKKQGFDMEQDAVSTRTTRNITITNGKRVVVEKKIITMKDGSTKIIENQTTE